MSDRTTVCADCGYPVRLVHRFPDGVEPDDYESHSALASQPEPAVTEALRRILDAIDHGDLSHDDYETGRAALSAATPQPDDCIDCTHPWREHTDARCARAECRCTEPNPAKPAPSPAPAAEPSTCPARCGCRLWTEDADARDCGCDGPCCFDSWDDYIADVLDRPDYYRELYNGSRATPLREARAASPSPAVAPLDVERLAKALVIGTDDTGLDPLLEPESARYYAEAIAAAYAEASEQEGEDA